jgi:hypothetical protein
MANDILIFTSIGDSAMKCLSSVMKCLYSAMKNAGRQQERLRRVTSSKNWKTSVCLDCWHGNYFYFHILCSTPVVTMHLECVLPGRLELLWCLPILVVHHSYINDILLWWIQTNSIFTTCNESVCRHFLVVWAYNVQASCAFLSTSSQRSWMLCFSSTFLGFHVIILFWLCVVLYAPYVFLAN